MPTHTSYNKFVVTLCCVILWAMQLNAQDTAKARLQTPKPTTTITQPQTAAPIKEYKPEILTSGFIDIVNNGQVNASARFIRLYIGEPGKFAIPLSIYSGVSANNFSSGSASSSTTTVNNKSNVHLINNFINPMSGLINVSFENIVFFKKNATKVTKTGFSYQTGIRVLTGYKQGLASNPTTGNPVNFFNSFNSLGLYFQTGAWERNNAKNVGVFWLSFRYIECYTRPTQLKEMMPTLETDGLYHGYATAFGIDINNLINLKVILYKYVKQPEIDYALPIYQFSFNYSLK